MLLTLAFRLRMPSATAAARDFNVKAANVSGLGLAVENAQIAESDLGASHDADGDTAGAEHGSVVAKAGVAQIEDIVAINNTAEALPFMEELDAVPFIEGVPALTRAVAKNMVPWVFEDRMGNAVVAHVVHFAEIFPVVIADILPADHAHGTGGAARIAGHEIFTLHA